MGEPMSKDETAYWLNFLEAEEQARKEAYWRKEEARLDGQSISDMDPTLRQQQNEAIRRRYNEEQQAKREANAAEEEARLEESLLPVKEREKRKWLAAHPDKSEAFFERHTWPLLKPDIVQEAKQARHDAYVERAAKRYPGAI
jgi:hypothetical protein